MKRLFALLCIFLLGISNILLVSSCGTNHNNGDDNTPNDFDFTEYFDEGLPSNIFEFTRAVMSFDDFDRIIPLGQINPPGHTFPTDHIYFVLKGPQKPVYAPVGGKVLYIEETGMYGDGAIRIGVTDTMTYYLGHVFVDANLHVGDTVIEGEQIAFSGNTSCVDFGLLNKNMDNGFLSQKLPLTTIYGDKPLSYYSEPLRSQLYAYVQPPQPSEDPQYVYDQGVTDGDFALDQPGTLCGNWLLEGGLRADGWYDWASTLAFGYDVYYPQQIIIGIGTSDNAFAINNADNPIRPENVSVSSGAVAYYLYNANNTVKGIPTASRTGLMMVQLLSDTRIKLEIFEDTTSERRDFTEAALYYQR